MSDHENIYGVLMELKEDMGEIKGTLKAMAADNLPTRVSALEQVKSWGHGVAAAIGAGVSFLVWLFTTFFLRGPNANP